MRFKVITLCGSMKFKDDFKKMEKKLTFDEKAVVLIPDFFETIKVEMTDAFKKQLSEMHKQRIDLSDEIFVINKGGYIGESTKEEIDYALKHNKIVRYME